MRPLNGQGMDRRDPVVRRPAGSRPSLHAGVRHDLPGAPSFQGTPLAPPPADAAGRREARDPAPSRLGYRLHRLWLTPLFRALLRVGLPAYLFIFALGAVLSDDGRRGVVVSWWEDLRTAIESRPEFRVSQMAVRGASPPVEAALLAMGPQGFPVSSFHLDLEAMRADFEALDAVARADLRIDSEGVLMARIDERVPAIVWRSAEGLALLDIEGHRIARLRSREARADLPLIAGEGADRAVPQALRLIEAAAPLAGRVRGLVRLGARRWDVILATGQRIMLPEERPVAALERVIAQEQSQDILSRDVALVDMRNPARPTVRLTETALVEFRRISALKRGASN